MRNKTILPEYIGKKYLIDTGRKDKKEILVKLEHIGLKFGELAPTRINKKIPNKSGSGGGVKSIKTSVKK